MPSPQPKISRRIFFALWPDQAVRDALQRNIKTDISKYIKSNQVRKVPVHNWHLTLAFVGNVSDDIFECCIQQASQVTADAFTIRLNKFDYFEKSKIIWLGCEQIDKVWYELVDHLNDALAICEYKPDRKRPIPHMSVIRKAKRPLQTTHFEPVIWKVREFALIESITTDNVTLYNAIKHWPLN